MKKINEGSRMSKILVMIDQGWHYVYSGGGPSRWPAITTTREKALDYKPSKLRELCELYPALKFREEKR